MAKKVRGILLTVWLYLMLILNGLSALFYLSGAESLKSVIILPFWIIFLLGLGSVANVIFTVYLFKWKKWAFFAFIGSAAVVFIINIHVKYNIGFEDMGSPLYGLLGPVILYLLMRPKWKLFT